MPDTKLPANNEKLTWLQYAARRAWRGKIQPDHAAAKHASELGRTQLVRSTGKQPRIGQNMTGGIA